MGRRPLVRRRWRCGHGVSTPNGKGCLPSRRDYLARRDSSGFDQGLWSVPSCPVNVPKVPRGCRTAASGCLLRPFVTAWRIRLDSPPPPEIRRHGQSAPDAGASPRRLQNAEASRKRHLDVGCRKLRLPRPCRISAGCLVSQSVEVPSDYATIQRQRSPLSVPPAPRRHQNRMFISLAAAALHADLAPRHYRIFA